MVFDCLKLIVQPNDYMFLLSGAIQDFVITYVFKCTQQFTQNNVYFGWDWYGFSMLQNANKSSNFSPSFDFVLNTHTK